MNRIYFLGSGKIAVPVMKTLHGSGKLELVGIGTQQDHPAGRHNILRPTPVGEWAFENGIDIDKPASVNAPDFLRKLREMSPGILLVVSFGQILRDEILAVPAITCVNIHASILPKYRGASPISAAILNGESETGISFMKMERGLDTGAVYETIKINLTGKETTDSLEKALGNLAAEHIENLLLRIMSRELMPVEQNNLLATYAGKIKKTDGEFLWTEPAEFIERKIRAYSPWPGAYFYMEIKGAKKKIQITQAEIITHLHGSPGEFLKSDNSAWVIACGSNTALDLKKVIPEGKKEMSGPDFVRGNLMRK